MCTEVLTYPENNMQDQLNNTCSCRYSVMNAVKEENFPNNKRPFKGHVCYHCLQLGVLCMCVPNEKKNPECGHTHSRGWVCLKPYVLVLLQNVI